MPPPARTCYTEAMPPSLPPSLPPSPLQRLPPWLPYVAPFTLFLALTTLEAHLPLAAYPVAYAVKIALTVALLLFFARAYPEARPGGSGWAVAAGLGVLLVFAWIFVDKHTPHFAFLGSRIGYDPSREISTRAGLLCFLSVRFLGLVVVVPVVEELFYRSFLLRFVSDLDDFRAVPQGAFTALALLVSVAAFALAHPEWLAAALFALAMGLLLRLTRNLFACILAHGTTNLLLGVYVLHTGQWSYW